MKAGMTGKFESIKGLAQKLRSIVAKENCRRCTRDI